MKVSLLEIGVRDRPALEGGWLDKVVVGVEL
jgi:hypothetical protein